MRELREMSYATATAQGCLFKGMLLLTRPGCRGSEYNPALTNGCELVAGDDYDIVNNDRAHSRLHILASRDDKRLSPRFRALD